MTKTGALYSFWASFGLPAYDEASVPTGDNAPAYPYITYEVATDTFGSNILLTGSVWYRSASWAAANAKADEIQAYIGPVGRRIAFDGGALWIKTGHPYSRSEGDLNDNMVKRKILNIVAEFITN